MNDIHWLYHHHYTAYKAMPDAYKGDNCLNIWIDTNDGFLKAAPKKDHEYLVGNWTAYYDKRARKWLFDGR